MKRAASIIAVVLSVGCAVAGWRGRFDEQFAAASTAEWTPHQLGPIAWYKLNGDGKDSSGNGYDCTWGGTEAYADGVTGRAASFNGSSYLSRASDFCPAGNITLTAWIKPSSYYDFGPIAGAGYLHGGVSGYGMYILASGVEVQTRVNLDTSSLSHTTSVREWMHVTMIRSTTTLELYINGTLVDSVPSTISPSPSELWGIGARKTGKDGWRFHFNGLIQDVMLFDRALNPLEISTLYHESINKDGAAW